MSFPAEHLLQKSLPDWGKALDLLTGLIAVAGAVWFFILPWSLGSTVVSHANLRRSRKRFRVPPSVFVVGLLGFVVTALTLIVLVSPYNRFLSRRVFQAPILTPRECQRFMDRALAAAERNVEQLSKLDSDDLDGLEAKVLEDPAGWQKLRYGRVPTTELNVLSDPFTVDDQTWFRRIVDQRLAPIVARVYGVSTRSIQVRDMFVVQQYSSSALGTQRRHADGMGDISFTISLNNDFEGGSTHFWNRHRNETFGILPNNQVGMLSTFPSKMEYESYPISNGRRWIVVGFLNILRFDADDTTLTRLSPLASWGNLNWVTVRLEHWVANRHWINYDLRRKVETGIRWWTVFHDRLTVHALEASLVNQDQAIEFFEILDESHDAYDKLGKARWLEEEL